VKGKTMEINEIRERLIKLIDEYYELPRYADIFKKMLGLHGESKEQRTMKILAEEYHVSKERIRQIYERCLRMLRYPDNRKLLQLIHIYVAFLPPDERPYGMWLDNELDLVFSDPNKVSRKPTSKELRELELKEERRKNREELGPYEIYKLMHSIRILLRSYASSEFSTNARICVEMRFGLIYGFDIKYTKGMAGWFLKDPYIVDFLNIKKSIRMNRKDEVEKIFEESMCFLSKKQDFVELMNKYLETFLYPGYGKYPEWMNEEGLITFVQ
jgi:hypothetical protein